MLLEQRQEERKARSDLLMKQGKLYSQQEEYLSNIAEINKINAQMGMPIIRTEVRYTKASIEHDVPNLQIPPLCGQAQQEERKRPTKGKKKAKKKKVQAAQKEENTPLPDSDSQGSKN